MPMIEMIFLLLLLRRKRGRRDAKEEERKSKSEKTFFFPTTHRHFDASGRLPADFHVEEHDWVGHDDDVFACAIQRKNAKIRRRRNSFPLFFVQKKERKSADNFTTPHKNKCNKSNFSIYIDTF